MNTDFKFFAASLTPFDDDGRYFPAAFEAMVQFMIGQGVHGAYVGGTTGEALLLTEPERMSLLSDFAQHNQKRLELIANVGGGATSAALRLCDAAAKAGYSQVAALPPPFLRLSPEELFQYYATIAAHSELPVMVYYFPQQSGASLPPSLFDDILQIDNISGVKFTSTELFLLERLTDKQPNQPVFYGLDEQFIFSLPLSPSGAIGSTYNVMGPVFAECWRAFQISDIKTARALQGRANELIQLLIRAGVIAGLKSILRHEGLRCGRPRAPAPKIDTSLEQEILRTYSRLKSDFMMPRAERTASSHH